VSIVEISTFRLAAGTDEPSFLAADRRVQTELVPNQPGFVRRTTARRGAAWVVVTLWATEEAAADFATGAEGHPVWTAFTGLLEPGSLATDRFDTLD
jgi:heme-degrading monooxygenase HmoA